MLDATSRKTIGSGALLSPVMIVFVTFLIFLLPQILIGIMIALLSDSAHDTITENTSILWQFTTYAATELGSVALLILYLKKVHISFSALGLRRKNLSKIWYIVPAFGLYFLLSGVLLAIAENLLPGADLDKAQEIGFDTAGNTAEIAMAFIALVIIAPFVEELIFRGFLFKGLRKKIKFLPAAIITSVLFGLAHFQLNVGLDTFALSLMLVWLVEETKNLWPAVGLHAMKNFIAFSFLFFINIPGI